MLRRILSALALVLVAGSASAQFTDSLDPFAKGSVCGPCGTIRDNLVAYWKLEESSGTRADSTGNGNDLSATNTPGNTTGKVGSALVLVAASSQSLSTPGNFTLSTASDFTVAVWARRATGGANRAIWSKVTGAGSVRATVQNAGTAPRCIMDGAGQYVVQDDTAVSDGVWYFHVCQWVPGSNTLKIRVDGGAYVTTTTGSVALNGAGVFQVGIGATALWDGAVDELGVWNRALTDAEVNYLYASGNGLTLYAWLQEFWFPGIQYAERDFAPPSNVLPFRPRVPFKYRKAA
jgi:hypothetical protein